MADILEQYESLMKKTYPDHATFTINLDEVKTVEDIVKVLKFALSSTQLKFSNASLIDYFGIEHLIDVEEFDGWE